MRSATWSSREPGRRGPPCGAAARECVCQELCDGAGTAESPSRVVPSRVVSSPQPPALAADSGGVWARAADAARRRAPGGEWLAEAAVIKGELRKGLSGDEGTLRGVAAERGLSGGEERRRPLADDGRAGAWVDDAAGCGPGLCEAPRLRCKILSRVLGVMSLWRRWMELEEEGRRCGGLGCPCECSRGCSRSLTTWSMLPRLLELAWPDRRRVDSRVMSVLLLLLLPPGSGRPLSRLSWEVVRSSRRGPDGGVCEVRAGGVCLETERRVGQHSNPTPCPPSAHLASEGREADGEVWPGWWWTEKEDAEEDGGDAGGGDTHDCGTGEPRPWEELRRMLLDVDGGGTGDGDGEAAAAVAATSGEAGRAGRRPADAEFGRRAALSEPKSWSWVLSLGRAPDGGVGCRRIGSWPFSSASWLQWQDSGTRAREWSD